MDSFTKIILVILTILTIFQIIYAHITYSSFSCPDCPECPEFEKDLIVPSNDIIINYINYYFINELDENTKSIDFLKEKVLFSNNYKVNFQVDAEKIAIKIRDDFDNKKQIFIEDSIRYNQTSDQDKKKKIKRII